MPSVRAINRLSKSSLLLGQDMCLCRQVHRRRRRRRGLSLPFCLFLPLFLYHTIRIVAILVSLGLLLLPPPAPAAEEGAKLLSSRKSHAMASSKCVAEATNRRRCSSLASPKRRESWVPLLPVMFFIYSAFYGNFLTWIPYSPFDCGTCDKLFMFPN